jgi:hypothetical protein
VTVKNGGKFKICSTCGGHPPERSAARLSSSPPESPYPQYDSLVASQSSIGRNQMLFGRWSIRWTKHQYVYLQQNNISLTPQNHGPGWSSRRTQEDSWFIRVGVTVFWVGVSRPFPSPIEEVAPANLSLLLDESAVIGGLVRTTE